MSGFVVVGTDTDAGKTSFSLLFLTAFTAQFTYWKPVETGESDTCNLRRLIPDAVISEPLARFAEPVAPMLAAQLANRPMPGVTEIIASIPNCSRPLLIESFGGPLSPLSDHVLQIELLQQLRLPIALITSSQVGAVGRVLNAVQAMSGYGVRPDVVTLIGPEDQFATEQIVLHTDGIPVISLHMPEGQWTPQSLENVVANQYERLVAIRAVLQREATTRRFSDSSLASVWHPYTPLQTPDPPLPVIGAHKEYLTLADGRTLIDGISSWWTILHGHRQPAIMRAIREATNTLDHVLFAGVTHPHAVELAEALLESMPWEPGGRVFYSDNGSSAVEVALKMAYQYWCHRDEPNRTLFVGFEHGYHGDTFGAMSVGRDPLFFGRFEPLLFETVRAPLVASALHKLLQAYRGKVAAVILEPLVQGAGGMRMHSAETLHSIITLAREHNVLFIADEVMTGFGRTGSLWAFEQAGISPDLVCLAKGITGGVLPLAATLISPQIVQEFDSPDPSLTFFHGHSFTANPIACAAAVANWKCIQSGQWKSDVQRISSFWANHVNAFTSIPHVNAIRIQGLIAAVELEVPGGYLAACARQLKQTCLERGVLLRPLGNVLYALPPFCTSDESLSRIADAMIHAIRAIR